MKRIVLLLVTMAALSSTHAQSLAEVAKQQRDKLCKAGETKFCDKDQKPDPQAVKGNSSPKEEAKSEKPDQSWMESGLKYQNHEAQAAPGDPQPSLSDSDVESLIDRLADKSARELGDDAVHDIQFPGRAKWEQQLYDQKEKLVSAGRATMAVLKSTSASKDMILGALSNFKAENYSFNRIKTDGIAQADEWDRRR